MARPGLGTRCVQAGYSPKNGEPRQIPIIQSTTFKYESSAEMGKLFDLEASGYSIPACRTRRTTPSRRASPRLRAAQPPC